jgi:mRNA interferase RelE/StbE
MARYRLVFKKSVAKDLRPPPKKDVVRILKCIDPLAEDPRPADCEKLSGQLRYRLRQGVYRIIYEIHDDSLVVVVVKIGHRREIYRATPARWSDKASRQRLPTILAGRKAIAGME